MTKVTPSDFSSTYFLQRIPEVVKARENSLQLLKKIQMYS
jgi:hypothetical protein